MSIACQQRAPRLMQRRTARAARMEQSCRPRYQLQGWRQEDAEGKRARDVSRESWSRHLSSRESGSRHLSSRRRAPPGCSRTCFSSRTPPPALAPAPAPPRGTPSPSQGCGSSPRRPHCTTTPTTPLSANAAAQDAVRSLAPASPPLSTSVPALLCRALSGPTCAALCPRVCAACAASSKWVQVGGSLLCASRRASLCAASSSRPPPASWASLRLLPPSAHGGGTCPFGL